VPGANGHSILRPVDPICACACMGAWVCAYVCFCVHQCGQECSCFARNVCTCVRTCVCVRVCVCARVRVHLVIRGPLERKSLIVDIVLFVQVWMQDASKSGVKNL